MSLFKKFSLESFVTSLLAEQSKTGGVHPPGFYYTMDVMATARKQICQFGSSFVLHELRWLTKLVTNMDKCFACHQPPFCEKEIKTTFRPAFPSLDRSHAFRYTL